MLVSIEKSDTVSRWIFYDPAFSNGVQADEVLFPFRGRSDDDGYYHESAILDKLTSPEEINSRGCQTAAKRNKDKLKRGPIPEGKRRYYCGYRSATYSDIRMKDERFEFKFTHRPEDDYDAHIDVALKVDGSRQIKAQRRTEAIIILSEAFGSPYIYRCSCDNEDIEHPFDRFGTGCMSEANKTWHKETIEKVKNLQVKHCMNDTDCSKVV
ncbi:hypothetical protein [Acetobacter sp. AAB5]|uniref:hypothetical protein n=1 Tax=Acetobacter sp. AAB5 TaxID=3418370 RepID=UPI003CF83B9B